jgi:hypothetical protein
VKFHEGFYPSENVHIMNTHIREFGMRRYNMKLLTTPSILVLDDA